MKTSKNLVKQYMNLIKNRRCFYKNNCIKIYKSVPTGLPSSTIIFTLIMQSIIEEFVNIMKHDNIICKIDYDIHIFVYINYACMDAYWNIFRIRQLYFLRYFTVDN